MSNYFGIGNVSTQFWIHVPLPQVEWFHQNHFVPNVFSWHSWIPDNDYWWGNNPNKERANLYNMLHDPLLWCNCCLHGCFYDCYDISFKVCKSLNYFLKVSRSPNMKQKIDQILTSPKIQTNSVILNNCIDQVCLCFDRLMLLDLSAVQILHT